MDLISFLVTVFVFSTSCNADWLEKLVRPEGWKFGNNLVFKVEDMKVENVSLIDRLAVGVEYGNVVVNAVPNPEGNSVEFEYYEKDQEEGRGRKKMGGMMVPFVLGAMKAGVMTLLLGGMKILAMKALILSKIALTVTVLLVIGKLFHKSNDESPHVEVEHIGAEHIPVYDFEPSGYATRDSSSYLPGNGGIDYSYFAPSAVAESQLHYATLAAPANNDTGQQQHHYQVAPAAAKRRDHATKRKSSSVPMLVMVKKITHKAKGL